MPPLMTTAGLNAFQTGAPDPPHGLILSEPQILGGSVFSALARRRPRKVRPFQIDVMTFADFLSVCCSGYRKEEGLSSDRYRIESIDATFACEKYDGRT
jgi:hypothetical protein